MNLLFDLDGTLADPMVGFKSSMDHAYKLSGLPAAPDSDLRKCIGPPLHLSVEKILKLPKEKAEKVLADYREHHVASGIFQYKFYDGADLVLKKLGERHKVYLATSKPLEMTLPLLQHFKMDKLFNGIYGSDLNGVRSNKSDLIKHIIETEKLDPKETIMIGDREHDALGAQANGVKSYGVSWGFGSTDELKYAGVEKLFTNWFQLLETLL